MTAVRGDEAALADRLRVAATALLDALDPAQRARAQGELAEPERTSWTYLPGERPGVRTGDLSSGQGDLAVALVAAAASTRGLDDTARVARLEGIKHGLAVPAPGAPLDLTGHDYWLRVLGDVDGPEWAWRLSGHHLVAQVSVAGDRVSVTPHFLGADPARVLAGPHQGFRALADEEDLARQLVHALEEDQRRLAVTPQAPADILSRHDPVVDVQLLPGLPHARMDRTQQQLLQALVRHYLDRAPAVLADRAWADVQQAGLGELAFSWAGGLETGQGHYYAVSGRTLLLEYDNTQDDANHVHSVWRDLRHDWGGDLLARHYRSGAHPGTER